MGSITGSGGRFGKGLAFAAPAVAATPAAPVTPTAAPAAATATTNPARLLSALTPSGAAADPAVAPAATTTKAKRSPLSWRGRRNGLGGRLANSGRLI